jgi:hypothetical protein
MYHIAVLWSCGSTTVEVSCNENPYLYEQFMLKRILIIGRLEQGNVEIA